MSGTSINSIVTVKNCPKGKWVVIKHRNGTYYLAQAKNVDDE